jgi:hypothetical protein
LFLGSSCSVRTWRTVHLVGVDSPRGLGFAQFVTCSCVYVVRCIGEVAFLCKVFADRPPGARGPSARHELLADRPHDTSCSRTVRGYGTDHPYFEVQYWLFWFHFRTIRHDLTDRPPAPCGLSARALRTVRPGTTDCLSPLLLDLHFCVALRLGLFIGLVGSL